MDFTTSAHRECFETVRDYLFALDLKFDTFDGGLFLLRFTDSPSVLISSFALGEDQSVVRVGSWLVKDVRRSIELYEYLLRESDGFVFGSFVVDKDGDVLVRHNLGGADLDKGELDDAISAVGLAAIEYQPEILRRFGGTAASYGD